MNLPPVSVDVNVPTENWKNKCELQQLHNDGLSHKINILEEEKKIFLDSIHNAVETKAILENTIEQLEFQLQFSECKLSLTKLINDENVNSQKSHSSNSSKDDLNLSENENENQRENQSRNEEKEIYDKKIADKFITLEKKYNKEIRKLQNVNIKIKLDINDNEVELRAKDSTLHSLRLENNHFRRLFSEMTDIETPMHHSLDRLSFSTMCKSVSIPNQAPNMHNSGNSGSFYESFTGDNRLRNYSIDTNEESMLIIHTQSESFFPHSMQAIPHGKNSSPGSPALVLSGGVPMFRSYTDGDAMLPFIPDVKEDDRDFDSEPVLEYNDQRKRGNRKNTNIYYKSSYGSESDSKEHEIDEVMDNLKNSDEDDDSTDDASKHLLVQESETPEPLEKQGSVIIHYLNEEEENQRADVVFGRFVKNKKMTFWRIFMGLTCFLVPWILCLIFLLKWVMKDYV